MRSPEAVSSVRITTGIGEKPVKNLKSKKKKYSIKKHVKEDGIRSEKRKIYIGTKEIRETSKGRST